MDVTLEPLCELTTKVAAPLAVGQGAMGNRSIGQITAVEMRGERLSGTLAGAAAADWMIVLGAVGTIDVRMTIRTVDDALIYVSYAGKLNLADREGGLKAFVTPVFETGDERYAWLNAVQAVGKGMLSMEADGSATIEYSFFELR